ncbi:MAG: DUF3572 domain-containing protein [Defluviimonas sp.]|nr:DUF3572 domain-containing protein [Defluviimonas sp.]
MESKAHSAVQARAETVAVQALGWLAADSELFGSFLGATGAGVDEVRARAAEPDFLGSVLDFLLMQDGWITRFCDAAGLPYDAPMRARAALPGGDAMHWT